MIFLLISINGVFAEENKKNTTLSIEASNSTVGGNSSINISLKDDQNQSIQGANITLWIQGDKYIDSTGSDGIVNFIIKNLTPNDYLISAFFYGDSMYTPSNSTSKLKVAPLKSTLTLSTSKITFGNSINIKAFLKDFSNKPIKDQKIYLTLSGGVFNATTDSNGMANFVINYILPAGTHTVFALYEESTIYASSNAVAIQTINKANTKIIASVKTIYQGQKTYIIAYILNPKNRALINKTLTLTINKKNYKGKVNSDGIATFKIPSLKKGTYNIKVSFKEDENYKSSYVTKKQIVKPVADLKVIKVKTKKSKYYITVKNIGSASSKKTKAIVLYGKKYRAIIVNALKAGKYTTVKITAFKSSKKYKTAIVNYKPNFFEVNYSNNKKKFK